LTKKESRDKLFKICLNLFNRPPRARGLKMPLIVTVLQRIKSSPDWQIAKCLQMLREKTDYLFGLNPGFPDHLIIIEDLNEKDIETILSFFPKGVFVWRKRDAKELGFKIIDVI
jgi:hypothetical protein